MPSTSTFRNVTVPMGTPFAHKSMVLMEVTSCSHQTSRSERWVIRDVHDHRDHPVRECGQSILGGHLFTECAFLGSCKTSRCRIPFSHFCYRRRQTLVPPLIARSLRGCPNRSSRDRRHA